MAIRTDQLKSARYRQTLVARSSSDAKMRGIKTAFLCHSHKDKELALGVETFLNDAGFRVYIDWLDREMPEKPNRETAARIKEKIIGCDMFLFLATVNSMASRWCPWEIGYADGKKPIDQIVMLPTSENGTTYGNEYLDLYRRIDVSTLGKVGIWRPGYPTGAYPMDYTF